MSKEKDTEKMSPQEYSEWRAEKVFRLVEHLTQELGVLKDADILDVLAGSLSRGIHVIAKGIAAVEGVDKTFEEICEQLVGVTLLTLRSNLKSLSLTPLEPEDNTPKPIILN